MAPDARELLLRSLPVAVPSREIFARHDIALEDATRIHTFELCRYLAAVERERVLCTAEERRVSVPPDMRQLLQLEEWTHPNVVDETERPSNSETFRQLASVLVSGDPEHYRPSSRPNTHWSHWPDGGTL